MLDTKIKVVFSGITLNSERQLIEDKLVTTYDRMESNVVEVSEELKKIENTIKLASETIDNLIDKALKEKRLIPQDFQKLQENSRIFETNIETQIATFSPILTPEEEQTYKEAINELKKNQDDVNCLKDNSLEKISFVFVGTGYGMSFDEDIFYQVTNDCEKNLLKYQENKKKLEQKVKKESNFFQEMEEIWDFFSKCYKEYKTQTGFVPRCLWYDVEPLVPYFSDPAFASGIIDGAAETIKMVADLANLLDCYNFAASFRAWTKECKEQRVQTLETLKAIKEFITSPDALKQVMDSFAQYIDETAGFDNQARYNQGKLLFDVAISFVGVGEIKSILKGGNIVQTLTKSFQKLPKNAVNLVTNTKKIGKNTAKEIVEDAGKQIVKTSQGLVDDIVSKRNMIRKNILNLTETKEYAKKYFDKFVKQGDFEDWFKNTFAKYENNTLNFEAHHIIPIDVLKSNDKLQKLLFDLKKADPNFNFDFNGIENGMMIQKKSLKLDINGHTIHNDYNREISKKISEIITLPRNVNKPQRAFDEIKELIQETKDKLEKEVLLGTKNVNDIINF
ncbi:AHH domain-containing protein [Capnocytophaga catalasegens]|uniref:Uncharacterized protein n=1 Tax=Capnocytophaga catalasegens TaxID=1004260 RepID=A0AAV5AZL9_9FLAO|nr:AHH domain-containing protein [Capnocytophaga catalasegens]GIZ16110.1 hypothetical protein RCZ03_21100 [Capnocytophaga catalasegens]GJM51541.1 hypothetical protein RCZ15_25140 [Capnocytophaga catalasegens]GJM52886.1 hypothetical protein RCZ16_12030 [Capnocytophaga catalasegens]